MSHKHLAFAKRMGQHTPFSRYFLGEYMCKDLGMSDTEEHMNRVGHGRTHQSWVGGKCPV